MSQARKPQTTHLGTLVFVFSSPFVSPLAVGFGWKRLTSHIAVLRQCANQPVLVRYTQISWFFSLPLLLPLTRKEGHVFSKPLCVWKEAQVVFLSSFRPLSPPSFSFFPSLPPVLSHVLSQGSQNEEYLPDAIKVQYHLLNYSI